MTLPARAAEPSKGPIQTFFEQAAEQLEEDPPHCGGWSFSDDVSVTNFTARATGIPGRDGNVLGDVKTGMAERIETGGVDDGPVADTGFIFPENVSGLMTACTPGFPQFLKSHPCQRPDPPFKDTTRVFGDGRFGDPDGDGIGMEDPLENNVEWTCGALCDDLNRRWEARQYVLVCNCFYEGMPCGAIPQLACHGGDNRLFPPADPADFYPKPCGDCPLAPLPPTFCDVNWNTNLAFRVAGCEDAGPEGKSCLGQCHDIDYPSPVADLDQARFALPPDTASPSITIPDHCDAGSCHWRPFAKYFCCSAGTKQFMSNIATCMNGEFGIPANITPEMANCKPCTGRECREAHGTFNGNQVFVSYYRQYHGSCSRTHFEGTLGPDDTTRQNVPVSCYGFYREYDPKTTVFRYGIPGLGGHPHCTIGHIKAGNEFTGTNAAGDEAGHPRNDFVLRIKTQQTDFEAESGEEGSGEFITEYGQKSKEKDLEEGGWPDPPNEDYGIIRNDEFDEDEDLWYGNISGGFSLINGTILDEQFENDITLMVLELDETRYKTYLQLNTEQPRSTGSLARGYDHTVHTDMAGRRPFTEWWQELGTQMHNVFTQPRVTVRFPSAWALDLDPLDPFFVPRPDERGDRTDPRDDTVTVQLEIYDDLLGEISGFFERSTLLRIEERPVPIVVYSTDRATLIALRNQWCGFYMQHQSFVSGSAVTSCDNPSGDVGNIINRIDDYISHVDEVRMLRADLTRYEGELLLRQRDIARHLRTWVQQNTQAYESYKSRIDQVDSLRSFWEATDGIYISYHDRVGMPYCLNQGFTTPIYSILDIGNWYPGRPDLDGGMDDSLASASINGLPRLEIDRFPDIVIDASLVQIQEQPYILPRLQPITIRLRELELQPTGDPETDDPELPDLPPPLPSVERIYADVRDAIPQVSRESQPPLISTMIPSSAPAVSRVQQTLNQAAIILTGMEAAYRLIWDSLMQPACDGSVACQRECGSCFATLASETNCCVVDKTEEDCIRVGSDLCVHSEMDLREKFVGYMCPRPAVYFGKNEDPDFADSDFSKIGSFRSRIEDRIDECDREDWVCQQLNRRDTFPQAGWNIDIPLVDTHETLRIRMFENTLRQESIPEEERVRYIVDPDAITRSLEVFDPTELHFQKPEDSSASATP